MDNITRRRGRSLEIRTARNSVLFLFEFAAAVGLGVSSAAAEEFSKEHARQEIPSTLQIPTVPAKAPKGIKVGIIPCGAAFHGCTAPADAAKEAAEKLGWTVTMYDGGASQQKQNAAILDAVSAGSTLICFPRSIRTSSSSVSTRPRRPEFPWSRLPKEPTRPIPS